MKRQFQGYKLSPQQERMWGEWEEEYGAECELRMEGGVEWELMGEAMEGVIGREEALRTRYVEEEGGEKWQVIEEEMGGSFGVVDLEGMGERKRACWEEVKREGREKKWEKERGPVVRAIGGKLEEGKEERLWLRMGGLSGDGKAMENLVGEMVEGYGKGSEWGKERKRGIRYVQYAEWANGLREEEGEGGGKYWRGRKQRQAEGEREKGYEWRVERWKLSEEVKGELRGEREGLAGFVMGSWQTLQWRLSGEGEQEVGYLCEGRKYEELEGAIGLYSRWVPVWSGIGKDYGFGEVVEEAGEEIRQGEAWQEYYEREGGARGRWKTGVELERRRKRWEGGGVRFEQVEERNCTERMELRLKVKWDEEGEAEAELHYNGKAYEREKIVRLMRQWEEIVRSAVEQPGAMARELRLLSEEERREILEGRRGEQREYGRGGVVNADYAVWQREGMEGEILQKQAEYWKAALEGVPDLLEVPGDHVRPAERDYEGAITGLVLEEELTAGLRELSKRHGTTLYMTLLAGWAALLGRLSGQEDVVIGTPVANRGRREIENVIGFFVDTLALRVDVSGSPTVGELLERVKGQALAGQQHQDIPFEQVEIVGPVRSMAHSPVFQVMFSWQDAGEGGFELTGLEARPLRSAGRLVKAKFDLTLSLGEAGGRIVGALEYATSLYERKTVERYLGYFRKLLEGMVANDRQVVDRLEVLGEEERRKVLYEWNDTKWEYPADRCVHELFEEQVERTPEATAAVFEEASLTYGELNRRANQLAHYLRGVGVKPDARVGICVERSLEMIVGLLGILKAGGAYVPLDPAYPVERLRYMLEDSGPVALLTQGHLGGLFAGVREDLPVIDVAEATGWSEQPERNPERDSVGLRPEHLAYVIYTSGTTGNPKGVMVQHGALVNFFRFMQREIAVGRDDVMLAGTSLSFDIAGLELYLPLTVGGRVRLISRAVMMDGVQLVKELRHGATIMQATPASWRLLVQAGWEGTSGLKALCGGEILNAGLAREIMGRAATVWNVYGPTETTIWSMREKLQQVKDRVGIGKPIANTQIYILDAQRQPVPVGVRGELYIGGAGVARGYLNQPELTAERFLKDPFVGEGEGRMYKTGDLGRWLEDSNIEFLGRNDFQVKIRGYRIELREIEARLAGHEGVREAVVVAREEGAGEKRLVAYYTCDQDGAAVGAEQLRAHLTAKLPEYMIPAAYVRLEAMPLTPNGKLDRKGLPAPERSRPELEESYVAPRTFAEEVLAAIWADVLGLEQVGIHDNFFALGGDSIRSTRVLARCMEQGLGFTPKQFASHPTIAELAGVAEDKRSSAVDDLALSLGMDLLSPFQLLLLEREDVRPYAMEVAVPGKLAISALRHGISRLCESHSLLRMRLQRTGTGWRLVSGADPQMAMIDLACLARKKEDYAFTRAVDQLRNYTTALTGPAVSFTAFKGNRQGLRLVLVGSPLAADERSWPVLIQELAGFTRGERRSVSSPRDWRSTLRNYLKTSSQETSSQGPNDDRALSFDAPRGAGSTYSLCTEPRRFKISREETESFTGQLTSVKTGDVICLPLAAVAYALSHLSTNGTLHIDVRASARELAGHMIPFSKAVGNFDLQVAFCHHCIPKEGAEDVSQTTARTLRRALIRHLEGGGASPDGPADVLFVFRGCLDVVDDKSGWGATRLLEDVGDRSPYAVEVHFYIREGQMCSEWRFASEIRSLSEVAQAGERANSRLRVLMASAAAADYTPDDFQMAGLSSQELLGVIAQVEFN